MSGQNMIGTTLARYFDAIYQGDTGGVRTAFHPAAHLYSATGGRLVDMPLEDHAFLVEGRPSPRSQGANAAVKF